MVVGPVGMGAEPPGIHVPEIYLRFAVHDPAGQVMPNPASLGNTKTIPAGLEKIFQGRCRAHQGITIGRIGNGACRDMLESGIAKDGEPFNAGFDTVRNIIDIRIQFLLGIIPGNPVLFPLLSLCFIHS